VDQTDHRTGLDRQKSDAVERMERRMDRRLLAMLGDPTVIVTENASAVFDDVRQVDPSGGDLYIKIPSPVPEDRGRIIVCKNVSDSTVNTVTVLGGVTGVLIDGAESLELRAREGAILIATEPGNYISFRGFGPGLHSLYDGGGTAIPWYTGMWEDISLGAGTPPSARWNHLSVYDPSRDVHVLWGGRDGTGVLQDWWELTGGTQQWSNPSPGGGTPAAREGYMMAYDPIGHRVLVFGGTNGAGTYYNDLWSCDGTNYAVLTADGAPGSPAKRAWGAAWFNPFWGTAGAFFVYGGYAGVAGPEDEVWCFDVGLGTWGNATAGTMPTGRIYHSCGYDMGRGRTVMVGGWWGSNLETMYDITNAWPTVFTQLNPPSIAPIGGGTARWRHMIHAPLLGRLMYIGNEGGNVIQTRMQPYAWDHDTQQFLVINTTPTWSGIQEQVANHYCNVPHMRNNYGWSWDDSRRRGILYGGLSAFHPETQNTWRLTL